jgi:hypothetical protein
MCMTEKDLLIRDWVGAGQLLVAAQQTVQQCINNNVFVVKSFSFVVTTYVLWRPKISSVIFPSFQKNRCSPFLIVIMIDVFTCHF